jgi:hypothetical protein
MTIVNDDKGKFEQVVFGVCPVCHRPCQFHAENSFTGKIVGCENCITVTPMNSIYVRDNRTN